MPAKPIILASALLTASFGCKAQIVATANQSQAPLLSLMDRFAAAEAASAPTEPAVSPGKAADFSVVAGIPPEPALPGRGLAEHSMLYIGEWSKKLYVIHEGRIIWGYAAQGKGEYEDAWMLSNGNILFTRLLYVAIVTPEKKIVWKYDAPKGTEIATCQPIGQDKVLFIENGKPPKLMVMNIKTNVKEVEHELPFDPKVGAHAQFRRVRYTAQGTYLVSFQTMNQVVEYNHDFEEVWKYEVRSPWAAIRLKNGNTLIVNERDVDVVEVNPGKEIVWRLQPADLPPEQRHTYVQSCTRLANGNTILCTHVGRGYPPQLIEVTRDKKVVWMLRDWRELGGSTALQVLDDPGIPENSGESEH